MHTPLTDEFEEDLSSLLTPSTPPPAASDGPEGCPGGVLPARLATLVGRIEPPGLKEFMAALFADMMQLLGRVEAIRSAVEDGGSPDGAPHDFTSLRQYSGYLLTNIETAELRVEELPDELTETLEAAGFALRHELGRVFEKELSGEGGEQTGPQHSVLRACALLENCFQQLTVGLARPFDAGVTGAALFENFRRRREESLALRDELRALFDTVRRVEEGYSILSSMALLRRVRRFRYERLHYLMYRDWEDFERFADALELCYESEGEMEVLLHKLSCYVEALLSQVELRVVLAED